MADGRGHAAIPVDKGLTLEWWLLFRGDGFGRYLAASLAGSWICPVARKVLADGVRVHCRDATARHPTPISQKRTFGDQGKAAA